MTTSPTPASSAVGTATVALTPVNDAPVGMPVITGLVQEDQVLTADTGGISDVDGLGAFSYQWLRDGAVITGATAGTYTLGDADVGALISVQVSYIDGYGTSEGPLVSAQTGPVLNVNDAPLGVPVITGLVQEDQVLTADTGGISDIDGLGAFSYQWLRDGVVISGATAGTYTPGRCRCRRADQRAGELHRRLRYQRRSVGLRPDRSGGECERCAARCCAD